MLLNPGKFNVMLDTMFTLRGITIYTWLGAVILRISVYVYRNCVSLIRQVIS